ncbi:N-(5'-phosphoribosyl)anthranilate isomerase [Endomicrobiia bacterium]|nr:N-(5'-phosphoribosyl)anthranilate isomerase [Endomicrobiia bacterium]
MIKISGELQLMPKIKICGLKREEDVSFVNIAKPDYAGFVFAGVKRKIDFNTAVRFRSLLDDTIQSVGVFVNDKIDNIVNLCEGKTIDLVQLHGGEDESYIGRLKERIKKPVVKAVRVKDKIYSAATKADFMLFDTYSSFEYGGSGKIFDWDLLKEFRNPFFLAGGLNRDNIAEAVKKLNPYCVDLSSGVETNGVKDLNKIIETVKILRSL